MKNLNAKISTTLKALRQEKGWSLDTASQKTGVSKAMLGQIERGESSPTIATLWKISSGFETSFSSFIDDTFVDSVAPVHRIGDLQQLHPNDDKIRITPLFSYDKQLSFEVFIIELLPGCEHLSPPHQGSVIEHVVVIEGEMEVLVEGSWRKLMKNEGLRFNADQAHGYRNTSTHKATFHDIVHYPKQ
ncbi:MAG: helix-turn-helix transcriptional regulator [Proteobacteria bacterium]|nr:helix-turn-helix transcriptional regulator [Pseudomonadota bacterium]